MHCASNTMKSVILEFSANFAVFQFVKIDFRDGMFGIAPCSILLQFKLDRVCV